MFEERRSQADRRVADSGPPQGMPERRQRAERRLPEVTEFEFIDREHSDGIEVNYGTPVPH